MAMQKIDHILMHDSAIQIGKDGGGWSEFHSEKFELGYELSNFLRYVAKEYGYAAPEELLIERAYSMPESVYVTKVQGEVIAPSVINLEVRYRLLDGNEEWTESITYCGHFTVWWSRD